jgi:hypothetical protein
LSFEFPRRFGKLAQLKTRLTALHAFIEYSHEFSL